MSPVTRAPSSVPSRVLHLVLPLVLALPLALGACGGGGGEGDDDGGAGDDAGLPDAPDAGGGPDDDLDPAACAALATSFVDAAAACGPPLPTNAEATLRDACEDGIAASALCGGDPAAGLDCFATPDADDWECVLGQPYPTCGGDTGAALGAFCLIALGNPACASGIACDFDVDCGGGAACNSVTGECFDEAAYCVGLPCAFDVDCPDGETCNGAEGACIAG